MFVENLIFHCCLYLIVKAKNKLLLLLLLFLVKNNNVFHLGGVNLKTVLQPSVTMQQHPTLN